MRYEFSVTLIRKQYEAVPFSFCLSWLQNPKQARNFQIKSGKSINKNIPETFPHFCSLEKESKNSAIYFVTDEYLSSLVPTVINP